jgi:hypothetical protein
MDRFTFRIVLGTVLECMEKTTPLHIETMLGDQVTSKERIFLAMVAWRAGMYGFAFRGFIADREIKGRINHKTNLGIYKLVK